MQESTIIIQKEKQEIISHYLTAKDATLFARKSGLAGRLEIQHWLKGKTGEVLYSLYMINEQNKIVGAIHPYISSIKDFISLNS